MSDSSERLELNELVQSAIELARRYREITGKPLGITGEVGEILAADLFDLDLQGPRTPGFDAKSSDGKRIQIKTRCIQLGKPMGRMGSIKKDSEWDAVMLVILNQDLKVHEVYECDRVPIIEALEKSGSKARTVRNSLNINTFKRIGTQIWPKLK